MNLEEQIWQSIAGMHTPGFFVTAEIGRSGDTFPGNLESFVEQKLARIQAGTKCRRFVFQEASWRIYLTFFPTTSVVDERYALKNKVLFRAHR